MNQTRSLSLGTNILVGKEGNKQENETKRTISDHYTCAAGKKTGCFETMD